MPRKITTVEPIINTPIVLSMATLMLTLAGLAMLMMDKFEQLETRTQASTKEEQLPSSGNQVEDLENDLLLLGQDPIDQELNLLESVE